MNRRQFHARAAAFVAAALAPTASRLTAAVAGGRTRPIEVDLGDAEVRRVELWRIAPEAYVNLEEGEQGDPGDRSGFTLRVADRSQFLSLNAHLSENGHSFGQLNYAQLAAFLADARTGTAVAWLCEIADENRRESGVRIEYDSWAGAPEISLFFGRHCCGFLCGDAVAALLACVSSRLPALKGVTGNEA